MRRQRLRIALLALGVVLGYGHAFAHYRQHDDGFARHRGHHHQCPWE